MPSFLERTNFKRAVTILATVFGIALGLCGLNLLVSRGGNIGNGLAGTLIGTGVLELAAIILSALGLVLVSILWLIATVLGKTYQEGPDLQRLFDDSDDNSGAISTNEEKHD